MALGEVDFEEAEVGEFLVGEFCSWVDTDEAYPGSGIEFWSLLEAADYSRINELEGSLVASAGLLLAVQLQSQDSVLAVGFLHFPHALNLPSSPSLHLVGGNCSVPGLAPPVRTVERKLERPS